MCDRGLQLQVRNKQEQMQPRAQSSCFHANVWDNKSQGGSLGGGWGGDGGKQTETGWGVKGRCRSGRISSHSELLLNWLGMGVAFAAPCPGPVEAGSGRVGRAWACACWGQPDSKCSSEPTAFPGL